MSTPTIVTPTIVTPTIVATNIRASLGNECGEISDITQTLRLCCSFYEFDEAWSHIVLIYLRRLETTLKANDLKNFCILSFHLWHKVECDKCFWNCDCALFFGIALRVFNKMESNLLSLLNFNVHINEADLETCCVAVAVDKDMEID
jgi:hypothetical protein